MQLALAGPGERALGDPMWARWNGTLGRRYTLGVEEELMLLDPDRWLLAQSSDEVLPRLSWELSPHVAHETHAAVVELASGVHSGVDAVVAELSGLRNQFAGERTRTRTRSGAPRRLKRCRGLLEPDRVASTTAGRT